MAKPTPEAVSRAFSATGSELVGVRGVSCAALYGFSPVTSKAENPDLDVVVVIDKDADRKRIDRALKNIAKESGLPVDAWILDADDLFRRMQRVSARQQQPMPKESVDEWTGPAFIMAFGASILSDIIARANAEPVNEAFIPPDPASKKMFKP